MTKEKKTLTRPDIIDKLVHKEQIEKKISKDFLETTLKFLIDSLIEKKVVKIANFGSFKVHKKPKRIGRNPKTGKETTITSRQVVSFKPAKYLRLKVKRNQQ